MFRPLLDIFRFTHSLRKVYKDSVRACWWRDFYASIPWSLYF